MTAGAPGGRGGRPAGASGTAASARESGTAAPAAGARHVHAWQGYTFGFDGERPIAEQACACGAVRAIRAWEAHWEPGGPPAPHPARRLAIPRDDGAR